MVILDNINGFKFNALVSDNLNKVFHKILELNSSEILTIKQNAKRSSKKFTSEGSAKVFEDFLIN